MDDFLEKLLKIRSGFFNRMKWLLILDVIAIFSIFYSLCLIFNVEYFLNKSSLYIPVPIKLIPIVLGLIIGIAVALLLHKKDGRINVSLLIENKFPELKEKLRTAYDNRSEANVILDSLKSQVSDALNSVTSSRILAKSKIITRLLITIIFIAGTATIYSNPEKYSIPVDTLTNISNTLTGTPEETTNMSIDVLGSPQDLEKATKAGGGNITGKPKIASVEGKNVDLTIYGSFGTGFEVRDVSQTQDQFTKSAAFPVDVLGTNVSDGGYSILMQKTETEKELINKYAVERSKI